MLCSANLNKFDWYAHFKASLLVTTLSLLNKCMQQIVVWTYSLSCSSKLFTWLVLKYKPKSLTCAQVI